MIFDILQYITSIL